MSVFCKAVGYLLLALPAVAQSQAFVTITIKSARSADPRNARVQVLPNGNLIASAVPVITLLSYAYDVPVNPSSRLSPLPDWTRRERYDIEGKAPAHAIPSGLQDSEVRRRIQQMIRGLLADRFRLVMRVENKTMSVYALTVASGGPKLQKSAITDKDCIFDTDPKGCHNWAPMRLPPPPPNATPSVNPFASLPTIFTVLGKLDLELKRQEDILPVYTAERIEPPTAN